jgi:predicted nucleic acid-binding protein
MNDNVFIDTNVLAYAYIKDDQQKSDISRKLLDTNLSGKHIIISTQVLSEFYSTMTKYKCQHDKIAQDIAEIIQNANVFSVDVSTIERCLSLKGKYGFSWWDSLILASALENDCDLLYSEDMQDGQVIEGKLVIKNPFLVKETKNT